MNEIPMMNEIPVMNEIPMMNDIPMIKEIPVMNKKRENSSRPAKPRKSLLLAGMMIILAACTVLGGCGKSAEDRPAPNSKTQTSSAGVNDVLQAGVEEFENAEDTAGSEKTETASEEKKTGAAKTSADAGDVDVDLTTLSSTIVYSEVYNMMSEPEQYVGKTVKMNGTYVVYHIESTNTDYFACIIQDATACCSQGMEFVLDDSYAYPEDYPAEGSEITVVGTFDTYMEDDYLYCTLRDAKLVSG